MTQIIAERKNIIFKFVEEAMGNRFINRAKSGLVISSQDTNQSGVSRWGRVTHVGSDVEDVNVDDYILIEPGKWTSGFYVDGVRFWKTDEDRVLAVSDEPAHTY